MIRTKHIISLILVFWAGFVSAISFFEAWLKFRADGISTEAGLSIGKLIFTSLNHLEIALLIIVWIIYGFHQQLKALKLSTNNLMLWGITTILLIQSIWLLPGLVERAELIIAGTHPGKSMLHLWFGILEVAKVLLLITLPVKMLRLKKG